MHSEHCVSHYSHAYCTRALFTYTNTYCLCLIMWRLQVIQKKIQRKHHIYVLWPTVQSFLSLYTNIQKIKQVLSTAVTMQQNSDLISGRAKTL